MPNQISFTSANGTTTATTSTQVVAGNIGRRALIFQNQSDTDMFIKFGAAASASGDSLKILAGGNLILDEIVDTRVLNVYCASSSKVWVCWEG